MKIKKKMLIQQEGQMPKHEKTMSGGHMMKKAAHPHGHHKMGAHHSPQLDDMSKGMSAMNMAGADQGDMSPHVESYQKPIGCYPEKQFGTTLNYEERHNRFEEHEAHQVEKQHYRGRYS